MPWLRGDTKSATQVHEENFAIPKGPTLFTQNFRALFVSGTRRCILKTRTAIIHNTYTVYTHRYVEIYYVYLYMYVYIRIRCKLCKNSLNKSQQTVSSGGAFNFVKKKRKQRKRSFRNNNNINIVRKLYITI